PEADDRRLVYADWLEEQGHAERAELVRIQVSDSRAFYPTRSYLVPFRVNELHRRNPDWLRGFNRDNVEFRRGMPVLVCKNVAELVGGCRWLDESGAGERVAQVAVQLSYQQTDADLEAVLESP